jgi:hypothetical protein
MIFSTSAGSVKKPISRVVYDGFVAFREKVFPQRGDDRNN